jgi:hypothetical protein
MPARCTPLPRSHKVVCAASTIRLTWRVVYCVQECGDLNSVKKVCAGRADCAGFTYNGKCGYLKTAVGGTKSRSGWSVYVKP